MGVLPAHAEAARARSALSAQAWKARPQAEQNRLTQAEEEDTSVQAYCADEVVVACALPTVSEHFGGPRSSMGRAGVLAELIPKSSEIGPELAQTVSTLKH